MEDAPRLQGICVGHVAEAAGRAAGAHLAVVSDVDDVADMLDM